MFSTWVDKSRRCPHTSNPKKRWIDLVTRLNPDAKQALVYQETVREVLSSDTCFLSRQCLWPVNVVLLQRLNPIITS